MGNRNRDKGNKNEAPAVRIPPRPVFVCHPVFTEGKAVELLISLL